MENVVPGTLQRLRAADIIRMAGLTAASSGQEYCRAGAVHHTQRQGSMISGIVDVLHSHNDAPDDEPPPHFPNDEETPLPQEMGDSATRTETRQRHYPVKVEIHSPTSWTSSCPCETTSANPSMLCSHAAALLYQWIAHPATFTLTQSPTSSAAPSPPPRGEKGRAEQALKEVRELPKTAAPRPERLLTNSGATAVQHGPTPLSSLVDMLTQLGLSELRGIAREFEIATNGMNKQQLAEAILELLKQPEAVRRVAMTLEKPPRQLLAALTLAGGSMTDDDLRGMFERFSLGQPAQLQSVLVTLQGKALLFRTSLNSSSQQRIGLSGALLDIGWHVPEEVRSALRVSIPVTPFHEAQSREKGEAPSLHASEPYRLLADLLLVARTLDGYRLSQDDTWQERAGTTRTPNTPPFSRSSAPLSTDGAVPVPPPADLPSPTLLSTLQATLSRPPALLRFAVRLLQLADIVHKDDSGSPYLRLLPGAAQMLLGPTRTTVLRDLFDLWLTQSPYTELFDLQEEGLRLRCRATSLNMPILRSGELEAENSEARQSLIALLAQAPLDQWISFPAFARFIYRLNPLFLQRRQRLFSSPHWWLELDERPLRPLQQVDWSRAELPYLSRLIAGPLHWWGACDIALSRDNRLLAFRLSPLASWLFNGLPPGEQAEQHDDAGLVDALEVTRNDELLVACSPAVWPLIELLETFMQPAGTRGDRLCYRLTPKALSDAMSRGRRPAPLLDLLRSAVEHAPSEPLTQMLTQIERWIASYGRVRIYSGVTLLETADSIVMRELSATVALNEEIVQTIHPTSLILKNSGAERVIDGLKRRGQSPLLHDEEYYGAE